MRLLRSAHLAVAVALASAGAAAQTVVFVKADAGPGGSGSSWAQALQDLQDAFDLAAAPASTVREIWVAAGTYRPDRGTGDRNASFTMRSGLMVLGGFSGVESSRRERNWVTNLTTLSGQLAGASSYHVVTAITVSADSLLDGFDITGGAADGPGAASQGGGLRAELSFLQVSACTFRGNRAFDGGAVSFIGGNPVFYNCIFTGNFATGNVGGLYCQTPMNAVMYPSVINCTFAGNRSILRNLGPALSCISWGGMLTLRNSILWGNDYTAPTWYPSQSDGSIDAAYCCQSEAWRWPPLSPVPNALYTDPLLVNAAGPDGIPGTTDDDLRILAGSPCIDSGDAASIPADRFDLNDNGKTADPTPSDAGCGPRLYDDPGRPNTGGGSLAYADMGAYEGPTLAPVPAAPFVAVYEGSSEPLHVRLTRPPPAAITLTVATTGDPALSAAPPALNFDASNWNTSQTVTVSSAHDPDAFSGSGTLAISGPGVLRVEVALSQIDTDQPPGLVYVKWNATGANNGSSWADAFTSLQAALTYAAQSGGSVHELWVTQGSYKPSPSNIATSFHLQNGLALYGGFVGTELGRTERDWVSHPTTLSGDLLGDDGPNFTNTADNTTHVVDGTGNDATAVLDGFVITGGSAIVQTPSDGSFGAGLYAYLGRPTIANCTFIGNFARIKGGGAYCTSNSLGAPSFTNCLFSANRSGNVGSSNGKGGGLFTETVATVSPVTLAGCTFQGNTSNSDGGGAFISGALSATDCVFTANVVTQFSAGGGGLLIEHSGVQSTILRCTFRDHSLTVGGQTGGGAAIRGSGLLTFDGCTFQNNQAGGGGGLSSYPSFLFPQTTVVRCTFTGNTAAQYNGGGLSISGVGTLSLLDSVFTLNSAPSGGAMTLGSAGGVQGCVFDHNTAGTGGAITSGGTTWTNCTFVYNTATAAGQGPSSSGHIGGGAAAANNATFRACTFSDNRTTGVFSEGGALVDTNGQCSISACTFTHNSSAWRGGAVSQIRTAVGCEFLGNSAADGAGAAYIPFLLVNCSFSGNSTPGTAGAAWLDGGTIRDCSFCGNTALLCGGVYVYRNVALVRNSILYGNSQTTPGAAQDAQFATSGHGSVVRDISYSCVHGWNGLLLGVGNTGANPSFYDPTGPDGTFGTPDDSLALAAGSPCIDAASNAEVPADTLDLDGDGNTSEPTPIDVVGLVRFIDDPNTPDTGPGTAPIVDMGAYETVGTFATHFGCYANCDNSTVSPVLNVNDFACFLNRFASGSPYANCDHSVTPPVVNVLDFSCFLNRFAAGCPE